MSMSNWRMIGIVIGCSLVGAPARGGLEVEGIGKKFQPDDARVPIKQVRFNTGGSTSVRSTSAARLEWKQQGYYQRNRDLGQVFTPEKDFWLDAIVLRTGPSDAAVKSGAPGSKVFVQFFEVRGTPKINDNGTPPGTNAKHGFSTNHRCDDFVDGVKYTSIGVAGGGVFPDIPITRDADGNPIRSDAGRYYYMRWDLTGPHEMKFEAGRRYAFMVGFEEPGVERAFTLANANAASAADPPRMGDKHDAYLGGWGLRREGDGTLPPTMIAPRAQPPEESDGRAKLVAESLFATGDARYALSPTCDGYPDVDTYRDHEFYLEVHWAAPSGNGRTDR